MDAQDNLFKRIANYYDNLIDQHGYSIKSCDYGHPRSQALKFQVLSEVSPLKGRNILDVGCGFADFRDFLINNYGKVEYTGIDVSKKMIEMASILHPDLDLRVINILYEDMGKFDIVMANGIFYLLGDDAKIIMKQLIAKMFEAANFAVAFNSLSSWALDKEDGEFYADPLEVVAFCRNLTPWIILRHDYHPRDFTIYLYKGRNL